MVWCPGESGDQPVSCVEIDTKVVLLREKILPARWRSVGNGKKFSLLAGNGRISVFLGVLGEFCTGWVRWWVLLGEFCTGWARGGCCWESFVPGAGSCPGRSALSGAYWGGFCTGRGGGVPVMGVGWCCCGRKFSLLGGAVLGTGKNSPCSREMAGFRCFWVCWESFVPVGSGGGCCRESFVPGEWWIGVGSGRKFSLLGGVVVEPGKSSPCSREMAGFRGFWVCWESFVPVVPCGGCCRESFVPVGPGAAVAGRVLYRVLARAPGGARCRGRTGEGFVPVGVVVSL